MLTQVLAVDAAVVGQVKRVGRVGSAAFGAAKKLVTNHKTAATAAAFTAAEAVPLVRQRLPR